MFNTGAGEGRAGEGRGGQGKNNKSSRRCRRQGERKGERGRRRMTPSELEGARVNRKRRLQTSTVTQQLRSRGGGGAVAGFFFQRETKCLAKHVKGGQEATRQRSKNSRYL